MLETISAAIEFLCSRNFELEDLIKAKDFSKLTLLQTAANAVSDSRESRKQFTTYANEINRISELDHWTEKQETRDDIETYIGAILWEELPESYSDNAIFAYRQKIYEYVFMRYKKVA